jgi:hypothetical protein
MAKTKAESKGEKVSNKKQKVEVESENEVCNDFCLMSYHLIDKTSEMMMTA